MNKSNSKKKNITIKSIAEELGVSFSTVSKSLNNDPLVKDSTQKMVMNKAREMGYSPNMLARGLRTKSSKTIGIIFNDIENPVLTYIFKTISINMAQLGYTTLVCDSQFDFKSEQQTVYSVLSHVPDFVIIAPATSNQSNIYTLLDNTENVIVFDNANININCNFIEVDYEYGGYISAVELLSKGHQDILIVTEPLDYPYSNYYIKGIKKAFKEYNVPFKEEYMHFVHSSLEDTYSLLLSLYDQKKGEFKHPFTGVLCFGDNFALGVYKACSILNLSIPDDISVIGFDDNSICEFCTPTLTTVHLPKEKMAEICNNILNAFLVDKNARKSTFSLSPHLVKRESVKSVF